MDRVTAACDYLLELRRTRRTVAALPADVVPRTLAEGYEVQDRLVRTLLAEAERFPQEEQIIVADVDLEHLLQERMRSTINA